METRRLTVPAADEILEKEYRVLDHGFVRLVDYIGGDSAIVQAARVAYGEGTKKVSEDRGLIRTLMRNNHTSPFEMVEMKFHCKMPIFVARQWVRHRTANINEYSMRYSLPKDEFYIPSEVRFQSQSNKQGSSEEEAPIKLTEQFTTWLKNTSKDSMKKYNSFAEKDVARELARIGLPLNLYTEWYWKIDLHNLFHFLDLRMDKHAQTEIRKYANIMFDITKKVAPIACEAFEDYVLNAKTFSRQELEIIRSIFEGKNLSVNDIDFGDSLSKGEKAEFLEKLESLKIN